MCPKSVGASLVLNNACLPHRIGQADLRLCSKTLLSGFARTSVVPHHGGLLRGHLHQGVKWVACERPCQRVLCVCVLHNLLMSPSVANIQVSIFSRKTGFSEPPGKEEGRNQDFHSFNEAHLLDFFAEKLLYLSGLCCVTREFHLAEAPSCSTKKSRWKSHFNFSLQPRTQHCPTWSSNLSCLLNYFFLL